MRKYLSTIRNVKNYLSLAWNRQFLAFLFFLTISAAFWYFQALNEVYVQDFDIPVRLTGVPDNVVITTDPPNSIRISLKDRGSILYRYRYAHRFQPIVLHWDDVATTSGRVTLTTADIIKASIGTLEGSTQITAIKPETIEFFFNHGQSKEVPVVIQGKYAADSAYTLMAVDVEPRKVLVYASKRILDTLSAAYLQPIRQISLKDTTVIHQNFIQIPGVKYAPSRAKLTFLADKIVEKTVEVPVQGVNFPATKTFRTFPSKVNVVFQVGMSQYRKITSESFVIVVNYEDLLKNESNHCKLSLKSIPYGVKRPRIEPSEVEYIIEETISEDDSE